MKKRVSEASESKTQQNEFTPLRFGDAFTGKYT